MSDQRAARSGEAEGERQPWTGKRLFDYLLHEAERARNPFGRLSTSGKAKWDALAARIEREIEGHPHQDVEALREDADEAGRLETDLWEVADALGLETIPGEPRLPERVAAILAEVERLQGAWRRSAEEMDWLADLSESQLAEADVERIAKEVIERFQDLAPSPDAPTQLGSEDSAPNTTAEKLGPASPDDRGGEMECEVCRGERWIGGELERRRPCPRCNS